MTTLKSGAPMADLFGQSLIPGLAYCDRIIGEKEEEALIGRILASELTPFRFHGWLGNRLTRSFGWLYDFERASFSATEPIPEWLSDLRSKAADFAGFRSDDFVQALVARYDPGAGIGWHRDRDVFDKVVGISLASPARLRFRRRRQSGGFDRTDIALAPRSAYLLSEESRWTWEHRILPGEQQRFSITFRIFSDKGARIANAHP